MFAVNGLRPGPNPAGQSYGEILRNANREERNLAAGQGAKYAGGFPLAPADHNGDDIVPLQSSMTTDKGVLGLESGGNVVYLVDGDMIADDGFNPNPYDPIGLG